MLDQNYEESQNPFSKVINKDNPKKNFNFSNINEQDEKKENYDNLTYSSATGGYICADTFLTNDQGIKVAPYLSKAPANINFDDSRGLSRHQGGEDFYRNKTEVCNMFDLQQEQNVFGGTWRGEEDRYNESNNRNNELPFTQGNGEITY